MKRLLILVSLTILASFVSTHYPVRGSIFTASSPCYKSVEVEFRMNQDRTVLVEENYILYLPKRLGGLTVEHLIPSGSVENIEVKSEAGKVSWEKRAENDGTCLSIKIDFPSGYVGDLRYSVSYLAGGLVSGSGPRYEARLGGVQLGAESYPYEEYTVRVQGPLGSRVFYYEPSEVEVSDTEPPTLEYRTSLNPSESFGGVLAAFYYTPAYYKLSLVETICNREEEPSDLLLDILLFSHGESQFAALVDSDPELGSIHQDEENNWYGSLKLKLGPHENRSITLEIVWMCNIHSPEISVENAGNIGEIPPQLSTYLEETKWWEVKDPRIRYASAEILSGEKNVYLVARRLVSGVEKLVEYTPTPERQGALQTLLRGKGDCDCFSDLLIALARAAGLPARLSFGWIYQENKAGSHAWAELYVPTAGWQPVDPTWCGNSDKYLFKIDPIHILRCRRGLTSSDSYITKTYYGGNPKILGENVNISYLSIDEAAHEFIKAAEVTYRIAAALAGEEVIELLLAKRKLDEARSAHGEESIGLALESIRYSNEILMEYGEPLKLPPRVPWWVLPLLAVGIVGAGAIILASLRSRR